MTTRVAFFDDQPIRLRGLEAELDSCSDLAIIGSGRSADDLQSFLSSPDAHDCVVIVCGRLAGEDNALIRQSIQKACKSKLVLMTSSTQVAGAVKVLEAGAAGYILSTSTGEQLVDAIRCVARGEIFITHSLAMSVINAMRMASIASRKPANLRLSLREEQILKLLLHGKTNKEIGSRLAISEKTVKHYMTILMQKMNARNRTEVVLAAQANMATHGGSREWIS
ncbi:LuxR C-terminal-related transcriptional regulator [Aliihoeflea sp. PC F10.4]